jgi:hypothetical protein
VWADSIGGERGELVVLQCSSPTPERIARTRELLARHGAAWSELRGIATRATFRRGFVHAIEVDLETCLAHAAEIARVPVVERIVVNCTPCTHWEDGTFDGPDTLGQLRALLEHPALAHIRELGVHGAQLTQCPDRETAYHAGYGDEVVDIAIATHRLQQLRWFSMKGCYLTDAGLAAIGRSGHALEELQLLEWFETPTDVSRPAPLTLWLPDAMPRLRRVHVIKIDDDTLAALRPSIEVRVGTQLADEWYVEL